MDVNVTVDNVLRMGYADAYSSGMDISHRLDEAMQRRGYESQSALARASGVPQPTINRILKGATQQPDMVTLTRLSTTLDVPLEWLLGGDAGEPGNSSKREAKPSLSKQADLLIREVQRLDGQSGLARKMFPFIRSLLHIAEDSSAAQNHAHGMDEYRAAEKALGMTLEGQHESGRKRKGR